MRAAPARAWSAPRLIARILRRVDIAFALLMALEAITQSTANYGH